MSALHRPKPLLKRFRHNHVGHTSLAPGRCGKARYFTVLDANQGYFQLQLDERSNDYTVFNTSFGRFRYRRLPMGITSAPGDASQSGIGCVLLQDQRPVAYRSKALTTAEYAYAQIEKELLVIVFAFKKFHTYVYGRTDVTVETDHLPLIRIFQKPLHQVPLRLQKMRMRLQGYDFTLVHKKGTEIPVADALSRAHVNEPGPILTGEDIFLTRLEELNSVQQTSSPRMEQIRRETAQDSELKLLSHIVKSSSGWPENKRKLDPRIAAYYDFRDEMNIVDGVAFKGTRIVIPQTMRTTAIEMLHAAHQGMVKTKQLARDLLYWPGINKQIEDTISRCGPCQEHRARQQKESLMPMPIPTRPLEHVGMDLFDCL
ncbi:PREDICTED: uncharacterized protein K02A2.6-like [Priapulus caudatus]|uniref:RNA-directed DNA polymerase n=1 Tax=Priapulus caudatus TaxID=37621 RepID=A0ABM1F4M2_PRICU|nr:PREDICTED: uncharacterized protein K02A2.6-like [Priapulus caudatus]